MIGSSPTYRQQRESLASALIEISGRQAGLQAGGQGGDQPAPDLLMWTMLQRRSLKPEVRFDLAGHLYLRDVYRCRRQEIVIYKASQMGASEWAISYVVHAADVRRANGLYVFPTDTHVSDFSAARIGPAIEASDYLSSIVVDGGRAGAGKRGADRVTLKRIRDNFIYLRGGQVDNQGRAAQLKSIDADVLALDEVDEMDPRAPEIAVKRLGHSSIANILWLSTPSYPGFGIHAKWDECDQREWHIRCEHCGERQVVTINSVVTEWDDLERPKAWHGMDDGEAWAACTRCGKRIDPKALGEWVVAFPERPIAGFHLTKFMSGVLNLLAIVESLRTTDETKRKETYNQDLGLPYQPRGGQLTDETLDACRRDFAHKPVGGEKTVLGADVGKVLHVVIRGPQDIETGERPQRFAGEVESFEALGRLIRQYNVERAVVDALPETRKARELQESLRKGLVWLAYYTSQKTGSKRMDEAQWVEADGVVNLDRTRTLDVTFGRFYDHSNTLPGDAKNIPDYYAHMKASVRALEDGPGGQKVAVYVASQADHYAHAENYCTSASLWSGQAPAAAKGKSVGAKELFN